MRAARTLILLASLFAALCCTSCTQSVAAPQSSEDAAGVRQALDRFFAASIKQDWDAAAEVMSDDFVIFTDGAKPYNKADYVKLLKADNLRLGRYELRDLKSGASGNLGWMAYHGYFESTSHGVFSRVETLETLLFRRESGKWRMFRAQATIRDLDRPEMK